MQDLNLRRQLSKLLSWLIRKSRYIERDAPIKSIGENHALVNLQRWRLIAAAYRKLIPINLFQRAPPPRKTIKMRETFVWQRRISFLRNCKAITWLLLDAIFFFLFCRKKKCSGLNGIWINFSSALWFSSRAIIENVVWCIKARAAGQEMFAVIVLHLIRDFA